jgi:predicted small secreted protein
MKNFAIFSALIALSFLAACNTLEGMGQDIKKGGAAIENMAR